MSENNFAKERRDWLSILLREILQNALDARASDNAPVVVSLKDVRLDGAAKDYMAELLGSAHLDRFRESVPHVNQGQTFQIDRCLVVEDFGTCGLTGRLDQPDLDGKGQNWNAFWFREGEGGKENSSGNGGAGQGKITYFSTSAVRTIFAYTIRQDDMSAALFGASSFLRDYDHNKQRWKRDAYWGLTKGTGVDEIHLPVQVEQHVAPFRHHFGIARQADQAGLSLVIPAPKEVQADDAVQITIAEFFVPILRGDLTVIVGDVSINKNTICNLADQRLPDTRALELHTCTTKGFRSFLVDAIARSKSGNLVQAKPFAQANQITEASFEEADLAAMREAIVNEGMVSVRFPVSLKPKTGPVQACSFDVHLLTPYGLEQAEQAVIRRDLLIGEEPIGGGKLRMRARGLTLIADKDLSRLLLSAEEATHLRWNTRLPRLGEYYRSGPDTVAIVRNAMVRLLDVLTGGDQKRDFKLLSKYFSAPGVLSPTPNKGKKSAKGKQMPVPEPIPAPKPKLLAIDALADGCRIRPAKEGSLSAANLPIKVRTEFAYEGLDKDAFAEYDPLDFDLQDKSFTMKATGCSVNQRSLNQVEFEITSPDFEYVLAGFDKNLRLRMRLNYEEASDAETIDA